MLSRFFHVLLCILTLSRRNHYYGATRHFAETLNKFYNCIRIKRTIKIYTFFERSKIETQFKIFRKI